MRAMVVGCGYGCVLLVMSIAAAAGGHGSYIPIGLFGSPLTIINIRLIVVLPVFWMTASWLADRTEPWAKRTAMCAMLAHYLGALVAWAGWLEPEYSKWRWLAARIDKEVVSLILAGAVYSWGQVWLWRRIRA